MSSKKHQKSLIIRDKKTERMRINLLSSPSLRFVYNELWIFEIMCYTAMLHNFPTQYNTEILWNPQV